MPNKAKVSVTINGELLNEVDRISGKRSRSEVLEEALSWWVRRHRRADLDQAIESYYRSLGRSERKADEEWAGIGDDTVRSEWSR